MSLIDLFFYSFALFVLFITPGPVWLALIARVLSYGWAGAIPLALAVAFGDVVWAVLAILSVASISQSVPMITTLLTFVAAGFFIYLGARLWVKPPLIEDVAAAQSKKNQKPGRSLFMEGFTIGLLVIFSNPKAILFYIGIMPGFVDLSRLTPFDIFLICTASALVPFLGNMMLTALVIPARNLMQSPTAQKKLNQTSAMMMFGVAGLILLV